MNHYRINDALGLDQFITSAQGTLQLREDGLHFRRRDGTDFLLVRAVAERKPKEDAGLLGLLLEQMPDGEESSHGQ